MTTGIFPETISGGLVIRDAAGVPTNPPNVPNAYVPSATFLSTCLMTALPADCTARITAGQINAIVSELVSFAECLDPNGPWDCNSLHNICNAFTAWIATRLDMVVISDVPPIAPDDNQIWYESDTGLLFVRYNDGTSSQWVQINGGNVIDMVSIIGTGNAADPLKVDLVDCGSY